MTTTSFTIARRNGDVHTVLVDAADLERVLAAGPWRVHAAEKSRTVYVQRHVCVDGRRKVQKLHRFLLDAGDLEVDHANGDGLDNRRCNLRPATHAQNLRNTDKYSNNKSGLKGVVWHARAGKWQASIALNGKQRHIGLFATPELAHAAYAKAAGELHGKYARFA